MMISAIQQQNQNNQSFQALKVTPKAKAIIEKQKGGAERLAKYTEELANSKWDLTLKYLDFFGQEMLYPYFGDRRETHVTACRLNDRYVMVYSHDVLGDNEDDIVDCLEFKNAYRAKQVYNKLKKFNYLECKSVNNQLDHHVYAMKMFEEAKFIPQSISPWSQWSPNGRVTPMTCKDAEKVMLKSLKKENASKVSVKQAEPKKEISSTESVKQEETKKENKLSFWQKVKMAWKLVNKLQ